MTLHGEPGNIGHNSGEALGDQSATANADPGPDNSWSFDLSAFRIEADAIVSTSSIDKFEAAIRQQGDKRTRLFAIDQAQWRWRQKLSGRGFKLYTMICDLSKMSMGTKEPRAALMSIARIAFVCGIQANHAAEEVADLERVGAIVSLRWMAGKKKRGYFTPIVTASDRMGRTSSDMMRAAKDAEDTARLAETERKRKYREKLVPPKTGGTNEEDLSRLKREGQIDLSRLKREDCPAQNGTLVSTPPVSAQVCVSTSAVAGANAPPAADAHGLVIDGEVTGKGTGTANDLDTNSNVKAEAVKVPHLPAEPSEPHPLTPAPSRATVPVPLAGGGGLFGSAGPAILPGGVRLPSVVQQAIDCGKARASASSLVDAIAAALARQVLPEVIEGDLRKCAADEEAACEQTGAKFTPSGVLKRAVRYIERSKALASETQAVAGPAVASNEGRRYSAKSFAKKVGETGGTAEAATLNSWLDSADELHGAAIATVVDCDNVLPLIADREVAPHMIAAHAIRRVYGYLGGGVEVPDGAVDRVASRYPGVPREFIAQHVENSFREPRSVGGLDTLKFNGAEWIAKLEARIAEVVPKVLEKTAKARTQHYRDFVNDEGGHFRPSEAILSALNMDRAPIEERNEVEDAFRRELASVNLDDLFCDLETPARKVFERFRVARGIPEKATFDPSRERTDPVAIYAATTPEWRFILWRNWRRGSRKSFGAA